MALVMLTGFSFNLFIVSFAPTIKLLVCRNTANVSSKSFGTVPVLWLCELSSCSSRVNSSSIIEIGTIEFILLMNLAV